MAIRAVQQFQLGTVMNNENQALETMRRMKDAGYDGIELCAFMIHPTPFMVKLMTKAAGMPVGNGGKLDWKRLIKQADMQVPSVHQYLSGIEEDPDAAVQEAKDFGAEYITMTGMYRFDYFDENAVKQLAQRLNKAGETLSKSGIMLLYHNHNVEFSRLKSGTTPYKILMDETDPKYLNFEFDSYWAADAGVNYLDIMRRLGDRLKLYHINDRGHRKSGAAMTPIVKQDSMELGFGNMDLVSTLKQAKAAGVEAVILESHRNWIDNDPIKSFELSAKFLKKHWEDQI